MSKERLCHCGRIYVGPHWECGLCEWLHQHRNNGWILAILGLIVALILVLSMFGMG